MRVLGVDPGCHGIAWAVYDDQIQDIEAWGDCENVARWDDILPPFSLPAAIESIRPRRTPISQPEIDTAYTIGIWMERLGPKTLLLDRATIRAALHVGRSGGDREVNAAMALICPALAHRQVGLNGHHRSACAVALVAAGRIRNTGMAEIRSGERDV